MGLNAEMLNQHACYFGGGTAIAMKCDEFRESVDMDFMVSDLTCYRQLRMALQAPNLLADLFGVGRGPLSQLPEIRADQYGIRTRLHLPGTTIKFEIVFEARIEFDQPGADDQIAGIVTLTEIDLVASKLLANVDRWADPSVMNRDVIDLAMLQPGIETWQKGLKKAESAYGDAVAEALSKAQAHLLDDTERLARCLQALKITCPLALVYQRIQGIDSNGIG